MALLDVVLDGSSNLDLDVGLDDSAEPLDVPLEVGLEGSADPLNEVLEEGNVGSADALLEEPLDDGLEVSVDSRPRRLGAAGKYTASLEAAPSVVPPNASLKGC
jgi:hypothetical protein